MSASIYEETPVMQLLQWHFFNTVLLLTLKLWNKVHVTNFFLVMRLPYSVNSTHCHPALIKTTIIININIIIIVVVVVVIVIFYCYAQYYADIHLEHHYGRTIFYTLWIQASLEVELLNYYLFLFLFSDIFTTSLLYHYMAILTCSLFFAVFIFSLSITNSWHTYCFFPLFLFEQFGEHSSNKFYCISQIVRAL